MTIATKPCATCAKVCYPTERIRVSDVWVHKHCLKCSECSTTLSLNSVYLAPSPTSPTEKLLYCAKDVPKIVHTSIVDSISLKTAMKAPNPTTTPMGVMEGKKKGKGKTIRFKGLTLRSKSIAAGLNAPKLDIPGQMRGKVIVGQVGSVGLDSWDIAHALNVQSQVSSPIRSHPAIHAQRTGSASTQWPMPSQPLEPQYTGQSAASEVMSASKGEEGVRIETDLVKNLIKVFQLDSLDQVEIAHEYIEPNPIDQGFLTPHMSGASNTDAVVDWQGTLKPSFSRATASNTLRTLKTLGSKKGTLTLARMKGNLRRPALSELFNNDPEAPMEHDLAETISVPQNTPARGLGTSRETLRGKGTIRGDATIRAGKLLEAFLPLAAHLVPLPDGGDVDLDEDDVIDLEMAQKNLADGLEYEGLELIMLFEELPQLACEA